MNPSTESIVLVKFKWYFKYRSGPEGHSESEKEESYKEYFTAEEANKDMAARIKLVKTSTHFRHIIRSEVIQVKE